MRTNNTNFKSTTNSLKKLNKLKINFREDQNSVGYHQLPYVVNHSCVEGQISTSTNIFENATAITAKSANSIDGDNEAESGMMSARKSK